MLCEQNSCCCIRFLEGTLWQAGIVYQEEEAPKVAGGFNISRFSRFADSAEKQVPQNSCFPFKLRGTSCIIVLSYERAFSTTALYCTTAGSPYRLGRLSVAATVPERTKEEEEEAKCHHESTLPALERRAWSSAWVLRNRRASCPCPAGTM